MFLGFLFGFFAAFLALLGEMIPFVFFFGHNSVIMNVSHPTAVFFLVFAAIEEIARFFFLSKALSNEKNPLDVGMISFLFGIGFALFEDSLIIFQSWERFSFSAIDLMSSSFLHITLSVFMGFVLWMAKRKNSLFIFLSGIIVVVALHFFYNTFIQYFTS